MGGTSSKVAPRVTAGDVSIKPQMPRSPYQRVEAQNKKVPQHALYIKEDRVGMAIAESMWGPIAAFATQDTKVILRAVSKRVRAETDRQITAIVIRSSAVAEELATASFASHVRTVKIKGGYVTTFPPRITALDIVAGSGFGCGYVAQFGRLPLASLSLPSLNAKTLTEVIVACPSLTALSVTWKSNEACCEAIKNHPTLTRLCLSENPSHPIDLQTAAAIASNQRLQALRLEGISNPAVMNVLLQHTSVTHLELREGGYRTQDWFTVDQARVLGTNATLTSLAFDQMRWHHAIGGTLFQDLRIERQSVNARIFNAGPVKQLCTIPTLTALTLSNTLLSDSELKTILAQENIAELTLGGSALRNANTDVLSVAPSLKTLRFDGRLPMKVEALITIAANPVLTHLTMPGDTLSDEGRREAYARWISQGRRPENLVLASISRQC